jgi:hypothetical protein
VAGIKHPLASDADQQSGFGNSVYVRGIPRLGSMMRGHFRHDAGALLIRWTQHYGDVYVMIGRFVWNIRAAIDALFPLLPCDFYISDHLNQAAFAERNQGRTILDGTSFAGKRMVTSVTEIYVWDLLYPRLKVDEIGDAGKSWS